MSVVSMVSLDAYSLRLASLPSPSCMNGTLWKRGRGKRFSFLRPWVQREIVLDCDTRRLFYKAPAGESDGTTRGSILLDANSSVHKLPNVSSFSGEEDNTKTYGFEIVTSDGSLELAADHEEDQLAWMQAIQSTIQQDIICEAKIQKQVFDASRMHRKEKEAQADKLINSAILSQTKFDKKPAAPPPKVKAEVPAVPALPPPAEVTPPPIPSSIAERVSSNSNNARSSSVEADKLFASDSNRALSQKFTRPVTEKTTYESDLTAVKREIKAHQDQSLRKLATKTQEEMEKNRMLEEVRERDRKVNELRRKHQVRANFRAAVKRSIIQYKFLKQMEDAAFAKKTRTGKNTQFSKEDTVKILANQGDSSDTATAIEKMLAKKKLERQLQRNLTKEKGEKKVTFPTAPKGAPPVDSGVVNRLFIDLPNAESEGTKTIAERIRGASIGPPMERPYSQRPPSGIPPLRPISSVPPPPHERPMSTRAPSGPPPNTNMRTSSIGSIPPPPPPKN